MNLQLIEILNIIVSFQLTLFAVFLFTRNTVPNRILGVFIFAESVVLLDYVAVRSPQIAPIIPREFHYFIHPFKFLWGPAFYFYIRSLISPGSKQMKKLLVHSIPFWIVAIVIGLLIVTHARLYPAPWAPWEIFPPAARLIFSVLLNGQITAYCIAAIWTFFNYRNNLKESYSTLRLTKLHWLMFIVYGYCFAHLLSMSGQALTFWTGVGNPYADLVIYLGFFVFFNSIFYNAWTRPGIFAEDDDIRKYRTSSLTPVESQRYFDQLNGFMKSQRPYLNPELSLNEVAETLHIPQRHVSQVINERFGQNFFDFVNSFRVGEAKRMLSDPESARKTVLEILYECGFNTKSSFYLAFRKSTGVAPKEYRAATTKHLPKPEMER